MDFDLREYIGSRPYLDDRIRTSIVIKLVEIALILFSQKILHRDMHCGNFLLNEVTGSDGVIKPIVKITDFGLAKYENDPVVLPKRKYYGHKDYTHKGVLKDFDKASYSTEAYSISRLINFVMTGNPKKSNHHYGEICTKAENLYYKNAIEFQQDINKIDGRSN